MYPFKARVRVALIGDESATLADPHLNYEQVINSTTSFNQDETFKCSDNPADYTNGKYSFKVPNTATLKGTNTDLSADAKVTVDCTLAALTSTKTANGSFDRTIKWALTKTVARPLLRRVPSAATLATRSTTPGK